MMELLSVPEWKWDCISMDFMTSLSKMTKGCDSIWVYDRTVKLYIEKVVSLHGIWLSIFSDRDLRFPSRFWKSL